MRTLIDINKTVTNTVQTNTDKSVVNGQIGVGLGGVGRNKKHESSDKQVAGEAIYVDDRPALRGELHAAVGQSTMAHANIISMDLSAVQTAEGVVKVITVDDVPGHTDIGPVFPGDPVLAIGKVEFVGQPLFAVAATSYDLARKAVKLAKVEYEQLEAVLTVKDALTNKNFVRPPHTLKRGDSEAAIAASAHQLSGEINVGGQEHMYLEGQVSTAVPTEDGGMNIFTSSQHPSEVQKLVAEVLDIPLNKVLVDMRRMGGGFGGKETQAAPWACIAALLANETKRPVKFKLARMDDMVTVSYTHLTLPTTPYV